MSGLRTSLIGAVLAVAGMVAVADTPAPVKDPITINYHRCDAKYNNWGVHLWEDPNMPLEDVEWSHPMMPTTIDKMWISWVRSGEEFGPKTHVNYIIHRGDIKEQGGKDMSFDGRAHKAIWVLNNDRTIFYTQAEAEAADPCFAKK